MRRSGTTLNIDSPGVAALDLPGPRSFDRFGSSVAVLPPADPASNGSATLLVGAPFHRPNATCRTGCLMVGSVYGFWLGSNATVAPPPAFTLVGDSSLGEFGFSIAVSVVNRSAASANAASANADGQIAISASDDAQIAISAPDASRGGITHLTSARSGRVSLFDGTALRQLSGVVNLSRVASRAAIWGDAAHGSFGASLGWTTLDDGAAALVAAAPRESSTTLLLSGREKGALYVWRAEALPAGETSVKSAAFSHKGGRPRAQLGAAFSPLGGAAGLRLAVGSPRAVIGSMEQAGAVDVLSVF